VTINEARRFEMHHGLRNALGDDVAGVLMDHLPPGGWADVARARDIQQLQVRFDATLSNTQNHMDLRFENLETHTQSLETRIDSRLGAIVTGLWTVGTIFAGAFIGLFTLIVSKL